MTAKPKQSRWSIKQGKFRITSDMDPTEIRAALEAQRKLLRQALGSQYGIYSKRKKAQKIGGSEK